MPAENYKNIIIGSGEGGKYLAWHLAQSGQKTAVVERRWIGGSCPNINCLPSKNEIWSAKVAHTVYHAGKFGSTAVPAPVDMAVVRNRKREMVQGLVDTHLKLYKSSGAELIMGQAKLMESRIVEVSLNGGGARTLQGERVFLNLGTHAAIPAVPGLAESSPLTNIELLELDRLPQHLIVIGGGYVGLEFAQCYRRFGSEVTIIQAAPQLLPNQDPDVSTEIREILSLEGINVVTSALIMNAQGRSGDRVHVTVRTPSGETIISGSDILIATGRSPNTTGIGLEAAGVKLNSNGYIQVNERLETTASGIWAIGECAGSPQFTHASLDDFRVIRDNLSGLSRTTRDRLIPSCLFTDPQVAQVGLTESEATRRGILFRVVKMPTSAILRTRTTGENLGFLKGLMNPMDDRILGFTMIGSEAGEVMAVVQMAMIGNLPYTALRDAIITHPTMAEGLNALFAMAKPAQARTAAVS